MILIWIWSLVYGTPIIRISALYLDFEGAKNIHVLLSPDVGLWWGLRVHGRVWHLDIYLDKVTGL